MADTIQEIKLKKFNPQTIDPCRTLLMVARRGSGKSFLIRDILYTLKDKLPFGIAFNGTESSNHYYSEMMPKSFIYEDFDPEVLRKFVLRQTYATQQRQKNPQGFVIFDDMMYCQRNLIKDPNVRALIFNGRHINALVLQTQQFSLEIPPAIRTNIDYVFAFRDVVVSNVERLWRHYFGVFPDLATFRAVFNSVTDDYGCLVLDNTIKATTIEECCYWYKAKPRPKFTVCSKSVWKLDKKIYNQSHDKILLKDIIGPTIDQQALKNTGKKKIVYSVAKMDTSGEHKDGKKKGGPSKSENKSSSSTYSSKSKMTKVKVIKQN